MNLSDIISSVRYIINDISTTKVPGDIFTYTTSETFTLSEPNVISVTHVYHNSAELDGSGTSTYDEDTNKITLITDLTSGDTVEVQYNYYPNYSITEIKSYIRAAIIRLSIVNYYTWEVDSNEDIHPAPTDSEKNMIAFVASILIEPDNKNYRLPDITITVPNTSLPTMDLINKAIAIFKKDSHGVFEII